MRLIALLLGLSFLLFPSCNKESIPKPRGYFRIDFSEKKYVPLKSDCPYSFEIPNYALVNNDRSKQDEKCWLNIDFGKYKSTLHLSYKEIDSKHDLFQYTEDCRNLAYKHTVKASEIDELIISNNEDRVYGIVYEIMGNTASSVQFYLTDSTQHFIRGSLYFNCTPNIDSLAPVLNYINQDIQHLINTFDWKKNK